VKTPLLSLDEALKLPTVEGDGPIPSRIVLVGEAPAKEEMRTGLAFTGPSGEILWQWVYKYLKLQRGDVRVENLFPFEMPEKKGKDVEEVVAAEVIEFYVEDLKDRLKRIEPEFIIPLGRYSTRALLGDVDLEWAHGIGFRRNSATVIGCFHPAAGLHSPDRLQFTALDLKAAKRIIDGEIKPKRLPVKVETKEDKEFWFNTYSEVAIDTEGTVKHPHSLQASVRDERAVIVRAGDVVALSQFRAWLSAIRPRVVLHNSLHDLEVLRVMGIDLIELGLPIYDTMSAAHVLQDEPRGLKALTKRLLSIEMEDYDDVVGPQWEQGVKGWLLEAATRDWPDAVGRKHPVSKRILSLVKKEGREFREAWNAWDLKSRVIGTVGPPPAPDYDSISNFASYARRDADVTLQAKRVLQARVEEEGLTGPLDLDMAVIPFLDRVMRNGLWCDLDKLVAFHSEIQQRRVQAIEVVRALVDDEKFNPGSADQVEGKLRPYLVKLAAEGRCRLTKSKKRFQVDSGVLEQLKDDDPLVPAVLEYRELDKMDGTYLSPLYKYLQYNPNFGLFRLPLNLRHAYVVSGRLSSHEPNVLAWPARTRDGLRLRECFTAPPGWMLGSWDLSQIEMRLAAGFSGDRRMLQAFEDGVDLHTRTAAEVFGVPYDQVDKFTQRTPIKTVSYLILYGGGAEKLFTELKIMGVEGFDRERCANLIQMWGSLYPDVIAFMKQSGHEAAVTGHVSDFIGRRRYLPAASLLGNRWPCAKLREEAGRQAGNHKIQAGAQDLLKRAEVRVMNEVVPMLTPNFEPCLQMHDEILALVKESEWELTDALMTEVMTRDEKEMGVRLECEGKMARSWGLLK
jgi:uracil-DNA glycosylase family 4